ncbi:beta-glucosidase [Lysobacter sp. OAE881]
MDVMNVAIDPRTRSHRPRESGNPATSTPPRVRSGRRVLAAALLLSACAQAFCVQAAGQAKADTTDRPWLDTSRSFEQRAADLVSRMTLDEKAAQMQNAAPAIDRLGVPAYDWWNEALHGVARAGGATVFPQAIGMAATFDVPLMAQISDAISDEARAKHHEFARQNQRGRYQGLTFWSPNINIFRDPRWGRGQETYGEDPYLTSRMGVTFVKGLQGDDPKYRKLDATAKHFAVHSGPEADRHTFDAKPTERDLRETYLPAFEALVKEGDVDAVMGAYNRVYGESASASKFLLQDILRGEWGFKGYVVSDCWAIVDIWKNHKIVATPEEAAALAVKNGTQLDCGDTYLPSLPVAVRKGLIPEAEVDAALTKLYTARMRLGMFDPPSQVRWAGIPYSVNQSPEHDALSRKVAQESIVLLKNDGVLPLSREVKRIAVVGPTADDTMALLGNYYGTPKAPVTILQGIREAAPNATIVHARGVDLVEGRDDPAANPLIEPQYLRPEAGSTERGLRGEYFRNRELKGKPTLVRVDPQIGFRWDRGSPTDNLMARGEAQGGQDVPADDFSIRWSGQLLPPVSGTYQLEAAGNDGVRLYIDDKLVIDHWQNTDRLHAEHADVQLEAGRAYAIRLEYYERERDAGVRLAWRMPGAKPPFEEAVQAARDSDVVIFVGGLTGDVEGEEMTVNYPRFRRRRPHRHPVAGDAAQAARSAARYGQAGRDGVDRGFGDRGGLGEAEPAGDRDGVVSRPARRQCGRRRAVRRREPRWPPARHLLQGRREAAAVRRLRDAQSHVPLLHRRAAVSVRPWTVVHDVRVFGPQARSRQRDLDAAGEGDGPGEEHRQARGRRGGAAVPASARSQARAGVEGTARLPARAPAAGRIARGELHDHARERLAHLGRNARRVLGRSGEV